MCSHTRDCACAVTPVTAHGLAHGLGAIRDTARARYRLLSEGACRLGIRPGSESSSEELAPSRDRSLDHSKHAPSPPSPPLPGRRSRAGPPSRPPPLRCGLLVNSPRRSARGDQAVMPIPVAVIPQGRRSTESIPCEGVRHRFGQSLLRAPRFVGITRRASVPAPSGPSRCRTATPGAGPHGSSLPLLGLRHWHLVPRPKSHNHWLTL